MIMWGMEPNLSIFRRFECNRAQVPALSTDIHMHKAVERIGDLVSFL